MRLCGEAGGCTGGVVVGVRVMLLSGPDTGVAPLFGADPPLRAVSGVTLAPVCECRACPVDGTDGVPAGAVVELLLPPAAAGDAVDVSPPLALLPADDWAAAWAAASVRSFRCGGREGALMFNPW